MRVTILLPFNLKKTRLSKKQKPHLYCYTVHFEDSLSITHQQMH